MGNFFKNIGDALGSGLNALGSMLGMGSSSGMSGVNPYAVGASALGGLFSSFGQDSANKQYMKQQLALMDKQQAFAREMFDKQLQANKSSIVDQFNQYRSLGINPLSTQGGLSQANVSAPSSPSAPSPQYQSPLELAQIDLAKSQAAKNYAEANAIDPQEAGSRTDKNRADAGLSRELLKTEKGMRRYKIADASANVTLTIESAKLKRSEKKVADRTYDVLKSQIDEANANAKLLNEKSVTEQFNRNQTEIMNKATREHWSRQDKALATQANAAMKQVALGFAKLDFEKQQWQEAGLDVQKKQAEYLGNLASNISKDTELKDIQLEYENGTFFMRVMAGNAQLRYQISQAENGMLHLGLDTEWMNEHGGMLYHQRTVDAVNAIISGYIDNSVTQKFEKFGDTLLKYGTLGKGISKLPGGSPARSSNGYSWFSSGQYRYAE